MTKTLQNPNKWTGYCFLGFYFKFIVIQDRKKKSNKYCMLIAVNSLIEGSTNSAHKQAKNLNKHTE